MCRVLEVPVGCIGVRVGAGITLGLSEEDTRDYYSCHRSSSDKEQLLSAVMAHPQIHVIF